MGSDRSGGIVYVGIVLGAMILIGFFAGLQMQMDQQVSRARTLKGWFQAGFLARHGLEKAALSLKATGTLGSIPPYTLEGGDVAVFLEGPRPAGSSKYVVFSRGRFGRTSVLYVADMVKVSAGVLTANLEVRYQELDPGSAQVRSRVVAERAVTLRKARDAMRAYRSEGTGSLAARLSAFLFVVADGSVPQPDRQSIVARLPPKLTAALP
ncbi:MAG: hypothetical protein HY815_22980 [Candidatus Riflebacteria bacterium]|nr:hypothetical protein [Candidatus Riflebacteria bacterium]